MNFENTEKNKDILERADRILSKELPVLEFTEEELALLDHNYRHIYRPWLFEQARLSIQQELRAKAEKARPGAGG